jgi:hypothetical protein
MNVTNHNGAVYREIQQEDGYISFYPLKSWNSRYSAYQLEQIAKRIRATEKGLL